MVYRLCVYHVILFVRMWVEISAITYTSNSTQRHPLREDVSWNVSSSDSTSTPSCHPLREDVSWNAPYTYGVPILLVILFVRMWVEIIHDELILLYPFGHPLREDVSWNYQQYPFQPSYLPSSSSWGCELKYHICCQSGSGSGHPLREDVSWNMLLEQQLHILYRHPLREDVSWNI